MFAVVDNQSDEALLLFMRDNDTRAFAVVVDRYRKQLYRQIYKRLGSEEDAKDMLQEIYLSLWNNRHSIRINDSFLPYLSRAAHNTIVDQYLFRKRNEALQFSLSRLDEPSYFPVEDSLVAADLLQEFKQELLKLPANMQHAFWLSRNEGLSVREIAVRLDLSEQTVKNYITHALQALRAFLTKDKVSVLFALGILCLY